MRSRSAPTVDPVDDCTFWYTNQYYDASSDVDWRTRVASFRFPTCAPSVAETVYLHGTGATANPALLTLDGIQPTSTTAKYRDSAAVKFAGANAWKDVGTWSAAPASTGREIDAVDDLHVWLGLKNSDDQGTRFDLQAQVYVNQTLVAEGVTRCITGLVRNPAQATEVTTTFPPLASPHQVASADVVSLRLNARIGTNPNGSKCGGHSSAVGLRAYFDATTTGPARFGLRPAP